MAEPATLDRDVVLAALREAVTVVKPGETLVIRLPWGTPARQGQELGDYLHEATRDWGIHTLVVPAAELGVARPETDAAFTARVARAMDRLSMRRRFPMRPL